MHRDRQYGARSHHFLEEVGKHAGGKERRAVLNNDGLASLHYWVLLVEIVIEMFEGFSIQRKVMHKFILNITGSV